MSALIKEAKDLFAKGKGNLTPDEIKRVLEISGQVIIRINPRARLTRNGSIIEFESFHPTYYGY